MYFPAFFPSFFFFFPIILITSRGLGHGYDDDCERASIAADLLFVAFFPWCLEALRSTRDEWGNWALGLWTITSSSLLHLGLFTFFYYMSRKTS